MDHLSDMRPHPVTPESLYPMNVAPSYRLLFLLLVTGSVEQLCVQCVHLNQNIEAVILPVHHYEQHNSPTTNHKNNCYSELCAGSMNITYLHLSKKD